MTTETFQTLHPVPVADSTCLWVRFSEADIAILSESCSITEIVDLFAERIAEARCRADHPSTSDHDDEYIHYGASHINDYGASHVNHSTFSPRQ